MTRQTAVKRAGRGALLSCALLLPLLSGCALYNSVFHRHRDPASCREHPFIGNTDSRPPLQVPEGMSAPDTRNAIKIPQLPPAPAELSKSEPCLAQPPPFYSKSPIAKPGSPTQPSAPATPPTGSPAAPTGSPAPPTGSPAPPTGSPAPPTGSPAPPATPPAVPGTAAPGGQ